MNRNVVVALFVVAVLALLQGCNMGGLSGGGGLPPSTRTGLSDVEFAKSAFAALANGDQSVASDIDWANFNASGQNVGSTYNTFHDEPNQEAFRKSFISSFSTSFRGTGGRAESLTNWTEKASDSGQTVVSAENPAKAHLLITVSKNGGGKKISSIQLAP